jgi:DnaJ-class molecular chaperone
MKKLHNTLRNADGSAAGVESDVCQNCNGHGWVYALSSWDVEIDCGRCGGTGRIALHQTKPEIMVDPWFGVSILKGH